MDKNNNDKSTNTISPLQRLGFAEYILITVAVLFVLGGVTAIIWPNTQVFEACKNILPPIATLIIGYYFGKQTS